MFNFLFSIKASVNEIFSIKIVKFKFLIRINIPITIKILLFFVVI